MKEVQVLRTKSESVNNVMKTVVKLIKRGSMYDIVVDVTDYTLDGKVTTTPVGGASNYDVVRGMYKRKIKVIKDEYTILKDVIAKTKSQSEQTLKHEVILNGIKLEYYIIAADMDNSVKYATYKTGQALYVISSAVLILNANNTVSVIDSYVSDWKDFIDCDTLAIHEVSKYEVEINDQELASHETNEHLEQS
jgi:hypothetical protein